MDSEFAFRIYTTIGRKKHTSKPPTRFALDAEAVFAPHRFPGNLVDFDQGEGNGPAEGQGHKTNRPHHVVTVDCKGR